MRRLAACRMPDRRPRWNMIAHWLTDGAGFLMRHG
jgi:hypothetical protein